jgi:hypothetical protein
MADIFLPSIVDNLWHKMRKDLSGFIPEIAGNALLMCCACGRFLPKECFDLEHLIPRQALKNDPTAVRQDPSTSINVRAGNLLLCKKPLRVKGVTVYRNGCNSWKGKFYDRAISDIVTGKASQAGQPISTTHLIAGSSLAYLAMVEKYGYVVALMRSGLLMRRQFFHPKSFLKEMPLRSQMFLVGAPPTDPAADNWGKPFSVSYDRGSCYVAVRNFVVIVPADRNPELPVPKHLPYLPREHSFRPNFDTVFD